MGEQRFGGRAGNCPSHSRIDNDRIEDWTARESLETAGTE